MRTLGRLDPRCAALALGLACLPLAALADNTLGLPAPSPARTDAAALLISEGNTAFSNGDMPSARRDYHRALAVSPKDPVAQFNLGMADLRYGHGAVGIPQMDRGIALARKAHLDHATIALMVQLRNRYVNNSRISGL